MFFLISRYVDSFIGLQNFLPFPLNLILGLLIIIPGFIFAIWANYTLYKEGKGTPVPTEATHTEQLVVEGPYQYSRNPMIFGTILIFIGLGLIFNSIFFTIIISCIITISLYLEVKLWEEKNLEKRFGKEYLEYKHKVSIIIPLPPKKTQ